MKRIQLSALWIFIFGLMIGAVSYNTLYMHKLEKIIEENKNISAKLEDSLIKLKKMEKTNQKQEVPVLNEILPVIINEDEEILPSTEINQYIKVLLNNQIGKELTKIDVNLIYNALNRRILKYNDGEYQLEIRCIILTDTMQIYCSVKKIKVSNPLEQ